MRSVLTPPGLETVSRKSPSGINVYLELKKKESRPTNSRFAFSAHWRVRLIGLFIGMYY